MLDQVTGSQSPFIADGAYDQDSVYADDDAVIVPPHIAVVLSGTTETAPTQRDHHLECIAEKGRAGWQKASRYIRHAKVGAAIGRCKQRIGDGLRSRIDERRMTDVTVAVHVLNRMLALGRPCYLRIA